ncbi:hypothetical protein [Snodgrassella communis]|uniref:hypothetical protein n=1 Tax=Snodgrassella communis TaxID=2946699 RepID=UPI000C1DDEF9|nr:hypothetical protein [Snodgrassella communis]PIT09652.1 hypothetical protein BGI31_04970 [Snodgrassella communis]
MVICIIVTIYILIRFSIWIPGKAKDFANANPRKTKYILIILALVFMGVIGLQLQKLYYEKSPYYFWNELMRKNPKPFNVSQEEFEAKNRAGYCWRDRKYYSKEELWHKAMKSLTGRMIYENKLYWDNKVIDAGGDPMPTAGDCNSWKGCRVWRVPSKLTNQKLQDYIGGKDDYMPKVNKLKNTENVQSYVYASDKNYVNDDFKLKDFILVHQLENGDYIELYGSDCCTILDKSEWSLIRQKDNYIFVSSKDDMGGTFVQESKIPTNLNINSLGVGNFYLGVTSFTAKHKHKYRFSKYPFTVFYLNNCGDILYKPYYW